MIDNDPVRAIKRTIFVAAVTALVPAGALHAIGENSTAGAEPCTVASAADWVAALRAAGDAVGRLPHEERPAGAVEAWRQLERQFPLPSDWLLQDGFAPPLWTRAPAGGRERWRRQPELIGADLAALLQDCSAERWRAAIERALAELGNEGRPLADELRRLDPQDAPEPLAALYLRVCEARRARRLGPLLEQPWEGIVFARHFNMGSSHYAYTEALSDTAWSQCVVFQPGSALCLLRMEGTRGVVETLLDDPGGVIRDVDVSWDGDTILFAWKKSLHDDDYSLYTMDAATGAVTALNSDLGHADYEGAFLPNGDIVFNSTRCVQIVDCWWTDVSNLYTCAPDGRFLRRLTFDQVHTNYPAVLADGRVVYTRWDYNDRGQLYPQGLFQMNPDGTAQQEFYGNNSWFPTAILHARGIPGTQKLLAVFTGHHSWQAGKLGVLDPSHGRQENAGARLVAPPRETPAERIDFYGQEGDLFVYPWPIDGQHFLVGYAPRGWERGDEGHFGNRGDYETVFGLYFMDLDGRRELLYRDDERGVSVGRMAPLAARPRPHIRPSSVDYRQDTGTYYVQDVYEGAGLDGVPRGTIRHLRVVALEYRPAGVGVNFNRGPAGGSNISTPISRFGSWDVKTVLGRATVHEDGSALFEVPARTPVYFQALDAEGHAVQSMRSWSTLQPGEVFSCVGCHSEEKHDAPRLHAVTGAMRAGVAPLDPAYGPAEGFSFPRHVQPILDRHCVACHSPDARGQQSGEAPFSLAGRLNLDETAKRHWSDAYLALTGPDADRGRRAPYEGPVRWIHPQSAPPMLPPYYTGAAKSPLLAMLQAGHHDVALSAEELQTLALWIDLAVPFAGDYTEAHAWSDEDQATYAHFLEKRRRMEAVERENIQALIAEGHGGGPAVGRAP